MENPNELVDIEPEMEDILSVWGKDISARNIERYFGGYESSRSETRVQKSTEIKLPPLQFLKDREGNASKHQESPFSQRPGRLDEGVRHANFPQGYSNKGKPHMAGFSNSGGLNSGQESVKGSGRFPANHRVSSIKDQASSQKTGDRSAEGLKVPPAFQVVGAEGIIGA